jgi:hypothetical protein
MNAEPRIESDYSFELVDAARRVLVDVGQVLAGFGDAIVIVGGWTPQLLLANAEPRHVGSIDVDIALDAYSKRCRSAFRTDGDRDSKVMPISIPK